MNQNQNLILAITYIHMCFVKFAMKILVMRKMVLERSLKSPQF